MRRIRWGTLVHCGMSVFTAHKAPAGSTSWSMVTSRSLSYVRIRCAITVHCVNHVFTATLSFTINHSHSLPAGRSLSLIHIRCGVVALTGIMSSTALRSYSLSHSRSLNRYRFHSGPIARCLRLAFARQGSLTVLRTYSLGSSSFAVRQTLRLRYIARSSPCAFAADTQLTDVHPPSLCPRRSLSLYAHSPLVHLPAFTFDVRAPSTDVHSYSLRPARSLSTIRFRWCSVVHSVLLAFAQAHSLPRHPFDGPRSFTQVARSLSLFSAMRTRSPFFADLANQWNHHAPRLHRRQGHTALLLRGDGHGHDGGSPLIRRHLLVNPDRHLVMHGSADTLA